MNESRGASPFPRFRLAGDTAFLVELGGEIDPAVNDKVMALNARIAHADIAGLIETVPTFRSILVSYDPLLTSGDDVEAAIAELLNQPDDASAKPGRFWHLPVCYDGEEFAPDLDDVAQRTGLEPDDIIARHLARHVRVYMLGTFPGYAFMGDIDPVLSLPRRQNPRLKVPAGSVGITGQLTGIYPVTSPGGWNLIGRSPARLFNAADDPPALLAAGDIVAFERIDRAEFDRLARGAGSGG